MTRDMAFLMTYGDVPEFSGCEHAEEIDVIQHYILGIGNVPVDSLIDSLTEDFPDSTLME